MRRARLDQLLQKHTAPWTAVPGQVFLAKDNSGQLIPLYDIDDEDLVGMLVAAVNAAGEDGPFLADVRQQVTRPLTGGPVVSLSEAYMLLSRLLDVLSQISGRVKDEPRWLDARTELAKI